MPLPTPEPWIALISAVLGTGGTAAIAGTARDLWRNHKGKVPPVPAKVREESYVDESFAAVVRARNELEDDNNRLRQTLSEERAAHAEERGVWATERARFRSEIATLETTITRERAEAAARYDDLLSQVRHLRRRAGEEVQDG